MFMMKIYHKNYIYKYFQEINKCTFLYRILNKKKIVKMSSNNNSNNIDDDNMDDDNINNDINKNKLNDVPTNSKLTTTTTTTTTATTLPLGINVIVITLFILCIYQILYETKFQSFYFLLNQYIINLTVTLFIAIILSAIIEQYPSDSFIKNNTLTIYYIIIIIILFFKTVLLYTYTLKKNCVQSNGLNYLTILLESGKHIGLIVLVSIGLLYTPSLLEPFYSIFDAKSNYIYLFAIGYIIGCLSWISETSIYYNLLNSGCVTTQNLVLDKKIDLNVGNENIPTDDNFL